jgi:hypothetical protein
MAGRVRKVYFLEPFFRDGDGLTHDAPDGFWQSFFKYLETLTSEDRSKRINQNRYRGNARTVGSPAVRFLYIGKRRPRQDWPDTAVGGADEQPLEVDGELIEPMYLLPVAKTNYVATLRSSGGPTFAAAEEWIGQVLQSQGDPMDFFLRSVVRHDALARLAHSAGVTMLDLKLTGGATVPHDAGKISTAVHELQSQGGVDLAIGLKLSFGHVTPDSGTARELAKDVERILRDGHGIKSAIAKVIETNKDGSISKDEVQFMNDRVTYNVAVGRSETEAQTAETVIAAMSTAVTTFMQQLPEILSSNSE